MNEPKKRTLIMSCSGAANVGQLSNQVALELVREGFARPFCLAGIGAHRRGFLKAAAQADNIVIDGCVIGCAKNILGHAEIPVRTYLVLTDLGIEKNMDHKLARDDVEKAKATLRTLRDTDTPAYLPEGGNADGSCCS
jgi:uncharacterized metal-binding protein